MFSRLRKYYDLTLISVIILMNFSEGNNFQLYFNNNGNNGNILINKNTSIIEKNYDLLENNIKPILYKIHIITRIHEEDFNYQGSVEIDFLVEDTTNEIILHAAGSNYTIKEINLINKNTKEIYDNFAFEFDENTELVRIFPKNVLFNFEISKEYTLRISFENVLEEENAFGFYRSNYTNVGTVWIASTHFEPFFARRAFPCFDEPSLKAKFKITITHGSDYEAFSNMPLDGVPIEIGNGMKISKFQETPIMSTYLVAFAVVKYHVLSETDHNNITHRILSPTNSKNMGEYAVVVSLSLLEIIHQYFGIKYPLPKIDHIAIPFMNVPGMENWGLITYTERILKYTNFSELYNSLTAYTMSHEISHQWFGNLVTAKRWDYIWLTEGFATFYGTKFIDTMKPRWKINNYFLVQKCGPTVFGSDLKTPLVFPINGDKDEWRKLFAFHSYCKGAYILQMIENALGEKTMKKGITNYLRKHQYQSVDEEDLIDALQTVAKDDKVPYFAESDAMKTFVRSWTRQAYIPIIQITRDYETGLIHLEQKPFRNFEATIIDEELWCIPITIMTPNSIKMNFIFPPTRNMTLDLSGILKSQEWLILNPEHISPYSTNYDESNWNLIIQTLHENPGNVSSLTKVQLITDISNSYKAKLISSQLYLKFFKFLKNETDLLAWYRAAQEIFQLLIYEATPVSLEYVKHFIRERMAIIFDLAVALNPSVELVQRYGVIYEEIRIYFLNLACNIKYEGCNKFIKNNYHIIMNKNFKNIHIKLTICNQVCEDPKYYQKFIIKNEINVDEWCKNECPWGPSSL